MMRRLLSLVLVLSSFDSTSIQADIFKIDWNQASIRFPDVAGASYDVVRLDVDPGNASRHYFSVGGALLASASISASVFPVTGVWPTAIFGAP